MLATERHLELQRLVNIITYVPLQVTFHFCKDGKFHHFLLTLYRGGVDMSEGDTEYDVDCGNYKAGYVMKDGNVVFTLKRTSR